MEVRIKTRPTQKILAALVLSLCLGQNAQGVDQYSDFGDPVLEDHASSVQSQEANMDAELSDAGISDFYPAEGNASPAVSGPPSYPRSEPPAKRYYEKSAKKKSWAKKAPKKSKNKLSQKKSKKAKKLAQDKAKKKKGRHSRSET